MILKTFYSSTTFAHIISVNTLGVVDVVLAEGQDQVAGASAFVEINSEDLSFGEGNLVEGEDQFSL